MGCPKLTYRLNADPLLHCVYSAADEGCDYSGQLKKYTFFTSDERPATISKSGKTATFAYNHAGERTKIEVTGGGVTGYTRTYLGGNYEHESGPTTTERLYLGGTAYNAPAVAIKTNGGSWTLYYIHRDYLGSIMAISDANTTTTPVETRSYDAWGRLRYASGSTLVPFAHNAQPTLLLRRGYTGHEHLPEFGLINMNARLYDPVIGRFLSPDPYVQAPTFSQSFNRYSYCINNPLIYTDPDGEFIFSALLAPIGLAPLGILIDGACWGAAIGGATYTVSVAFSDGGFKQNWNPNDFWRSVGVGAASGFVTAGMGLISPPFTVYSTSFTGNLPQYLGKAGWAGLTAAAATGAGMMTSDLIQYGRLETDYKDYLKPMGVSALTAGLLSFCTSIHDYRTWDKYTYVEQTKILQQEFGVKVVYDPNLPSNEYGVFDPTKPNQVSISRRGGV